jgi:hypothetical protein
MVGEAQNEEKKNSHGRGSTKTKIVILMVGKAQKEKKILMLGKAQKRKKEILMVGEAQNKEKKFSW